MFGKGIAQLVKLLRHLVALPNCNWRNDWQLVSWACATRTLARLEALLGWPEHRGKV